MRTVVLADHGKMFFSVTWEAFLLLAGLLGVCLLLPVDEFSEVWCQELVVQCTAAVCQAVQQCKWVHRASVESVLLSVHHCWDGDGRDSGHDTLTSCWWPGGWWCDVLLCEPGGMPSCKPI